MSYIDCYDHSDVGRFLGLVLYHPLESLNDECFDADQYSLVLGGGGAYGSGEHPSIVFKDVCEPIHCYLNFLHTHKQLGLNDTMTPVIDLLLEDMENYLLTYTDGDFPEHMMYHALGMDEIVSLGRKIDAAFTEWTERHNIQSSQRNISYERKLAILLGEVAYFLTRRLAKTGFRDALDHFDAVVRDNGGYITHQFDVFYPAIVGWRCYGRTKYLDVNGERRIHQGVSFIDEEAIVAMAQDLNLKRDSNATSN